MTPHGRKIWGSRQGQNLLKAMLDGGPLKPEHEETVAQLKKSGPPTKAPIETLREKQPDAKPER